MEKTIKEIADELNVDKQKVYRFIKRHHISEVHQKKDVMYYDDAVQSLLILHFKKSDVVEVQENSYNNSLIDTIIEMQKNEIAAQKKQLEVKDTQIAELIRLLDKQQQLHLTEQKK